MTEAKAFAESYIEKEYAALWAMYGDPDAEFIPKLQALNAMFGREVKTKSALFRSATPAEELEAAKRERERLLKRRLLEVAEFEMPERGRVFRFVLSGSKTYTPPGPEMALFAAPVQGDWKIFARYSSCLPCEGTGLVSGTTCIECEGSGWRFNGGPMFDARSPGKLIAKETFA